MNIARIIAKTRRVYRNGAITEISPLLVAKTSIKYEKVPNKVIAKTTNHCVTVKETNWPKKGMEIIPPTTVSINAYREIVIEWISLLIFRVTKSLNGGEVYAGFPATKIREHNRREALINKMNKIEKNLKRVQSKK